MHLLLLPCSASLAPSPPLLFPTGTTPNVRAAYLVDPVDGFALTKTMLGYPSAVKLLRDRSMKLGITGKTTSGQLWHGCFTATHKHVHASE